MHRINYNLRRRVAAEIRNHSPRRSLSHTVLSHSLARLSWRRRDVYRLERTDRLFSEGVPKRRVRGIRARAFRTLFSWRRVKKKTKTTNFSNPRFRQRSERPLSRVRGAAPLLRRAVRPAIDAAAVVVSVNVMRRPRGRTRQ